MVTKEIRDIVFDFPVGRRDKGFSADDARIGKIPGPATEPPGSG